MARPIKEPPRTERERSGKICRKNSKSRSCQPIRKRCGRKAYEAFKAISTFQM